MDKNIFDRINSYYNNLVDSYGHNPKACDYGHPESQKIKFRVLTEGIEFAGKSVLDIGCGFADFYSYLKASYPDLHYTGFDISDAMVKKARELNPGIRIEQKNILTDNFEEKFDIVTANGIFYLLGNDAEHLMQNLIAKMFSLANEYVLFNSLSRLAKDQEANEFYADPAEVLKFCQTLTPWVRLRHDYHERDFTIMLSKSKSKFSPN